MNSAVILPIFILILWSQEALSSKSDIDFVVVPKGKYWIGCDAARDKQCGASEKTGSLVEVNSFEISKFETTQKQYDQCVKEKKCTNPNKNFHPSSKGRHPVTNVTWSQADQFCKWMGGKLPSDIEWEVGARGTDSRTYAWGDEPPKCKTANSSYLCNSTIKPVGSYSSDVSPFGIYDMIGNVEEWVSDWYNQKSTANTAKLLPEIVAESKKEISIRGGSYRSDVWHSRITLRMYARANDASDERGFRCVRNH